MRDIYIKICIYILFILPSVFWGRKELVKEVTDSSRERRATDLTTKPEGR